MKLQQLLDNLDKSDVNKVNLYYVPDDLLRAVGVPNLTFEEDPVKLSVYWLAESTDDYCDNVGSKAYFLEDTFICLSNKYERKGMEHFSFESMESLSMLKEYLESTAYDWSLHVVNLIDQDTDIGSAWDLGHCTPVPWKTNKG